MGLDSIWYCYECNLELHRPQRIQTRISSPISSLSSEEYWDTYMDVSRKASFSNVKFQRGCSLIYGLLAQAFHPAGPDGIRGQGSHLLIGLIALRPKRSVLSPV